MNPELLLWPCSFSGIPFQAAVETTADGRRLIVHEIPLSDKPSIQDLGAKVRRFSLTAYVASTGVEVASYAAIEILKGLGPAPLVLPGAGPLVAHCEDVVRTISLDKIGYAAFEIKFLGEGLVSALVSALGLAALVYDAADSLVSSITAIPSIVTVGGYGDEVTGAVVGDAQDLVAGLEAIRGESQIADAAVNTALADDLASLYAAAPNAVGGTVGLSNEFVEGTFAAARTLGDAMDADAAASAFGAAADAIEAPVVTATMAPSTALIAGNGAAMAALSRAVYLTAYVEATVRRTFADRRAGQAARLDLARRFDAALAEAGGAANIGWQADLLDMRSAALEQISRVITDLRPIVTISAPRQMPAVWWAYRLYGSTDMADDLVARNRVRHPGYMPETFEALAP